MALFGTTAAMLGGVCSTRPALHGARACLEMTTKKIGGAETTRRPLGRATEIAENTTGLGKSLPRVEIGT